jgi:hypothetical protein
MGRRHQDFSRSLIGQRKQAIRLQGEIVPATTYGTSQFRLGL